ncbi:MAG: methyltransferase domain-containing protein [Planctomycetota bacterium]
MGHDGWLADIFTLMFELRCTVRRCEKVLCLTDRGLTCAAGHHFDRAKQGYWNLLQPQDRRSKSPGDSDDAVDARERWLSRGHNDGLVETLRDWIEIDDQSRSARVLDLGCGVGAFGASLFACQATGYCGIDLSKRAIKIAARRWPEATWVLANADRGLPSRNESVDTVISLFGRRPLTEIQRVLRSGGQCIVAVPAEDDLIELRTLVQQEGRRRSRWKQIVDQMRDADMECVARTTWREQVELAPDAISDALAMTYRAVRRSQQSRVDALGPTRVTLAADCLRFHRGPTERSRYQSSHRSHGLADET